MRNLTPEYRCHRRIPESPIAKPGQPVQNAAGSIANVMMCGACRAINADGSRFCAQCGSELGREPALSAATQPHSPFFHSHSVAKLLVLGGLTFSLYTVYWFWTQWRSDAPDEKPVWAAIKTVLSGFFFYSMARATKDEADSRDLVCRYSPAVLTAVLWGATIATRLIPDVWTLATVWLVVAPLVPVQIAINQVNRVVGRPAPAPWRWWETTLASGLGVVWALAAVGLLVGGV